MYRQRLAPPEKLEPRVVLDSTTVFNEIMYHPADDETPEWIELHNQMSVDMDLSGWSLDGAVEFEFAPETVIAGGGFLVVSADPQALTNGTGYSGVLGPFRGNLSNGGEQLELRNNNNRVMNVLDYGDDGAWPVGPDGSGATLAKAKEGLASASADNWKTSLQIGGTPGAENFPAVSQSQSVLIDIADEWRYDDSGTDLGTAWLQPEFDDTNWTMGGALFFDSPAVLPAPKVTPLAHGHNTYYFRTDFQYDGANIPDEVRLRPIVDDGAVFYLNGTEVLRVNMPAGPIVFGTPASTGVIDAMGTDVFTLPADQLVVGTNTLAVEVHQSSFEGVSLPVQNASFEADSPHPYFGPTGWTATGISFAGFTRVTLVDHADEQGVTTPYPDGSQALILRSKDGQSLAIHQDLGSVDESTYDVSFAVADRFASQWLNYKAELLAVDGGNTATVIVSEDSAINQMIRPVNGSTSHPHSPGLPGAEGDWLQVRLQGAAGANIRGQTLRLRFSTSARSTGDAGDNLFEVAIDDVSVRTSQAAAAADAAFGTNLIVVETLPPPNARSLVLNEFAGSGEDDFWLEIANASTSDFDLTGVEIRRANTSVNSSDSYVFPSQTLPAGGVLVVDEAALGFEAVVGDRLFLVLSGGTTVLDARIVADGVRGRAVDGTDRWLVPDVATRGASNRFALHDGIVINEIMYQHRPKLGTPAIPASFEVTPLVPFESNWRYNDSGADLGAGWQQIVHPVGGAWQQGPGLIGFETAALSRPIETVLADPFLSDPFVTTYYFESEFSLTQTDLDDIDELHLRHIIDDGAIFYLNGNEVSRFNMPEGPINSSTFSSQGVGNASLSDATVLSKELLQVGTNRMSVEVHTALRRFDTDIVFGVELANATEITPAVPSTHFVENSQEWIELYNRSNTAVDLTDWQIDDAVSFAFPAGTTLGPGDYLVVARDAAALQQAYPTQTNILGNLSGNLSNRSERILLLDRVGNPADEVHYFDDGRWDQWADGAGPSLELRDPHSDNSVGEAWSASDESSNSSWQSYSYRGTAAKTIPGEPSVWHELAFGFLDGAGEVLIDDVSVVQAPDGAATEMIQNGTFDDGTNHWRLLGNHQRSEVIDDNGNQVLHLISSGATEYQGNQIETTFADGNRVISGQEYEISFRAKWLAGSRQINSRLYFNQLAKTTSLDVPDRNGTPGRPNSRLVANAGPTYSRLLHNPAVPAVNEAITISVEAHDPDGVDRMTLWYRLDNAAWISMPMAAGEDGVFSAAVPGQSAGTVIHFYVEGWDARGAVSQFPAAGPNSRALVQIEDGRGADGPLHNFRVVMLPSEASLLHLSTNTLSNERLGATVIYEDELFYDVGIRLKGSFVGRDAARVGFNIAFNPDQLFRGVHDKVAVDRSTHANIGVDEILIKHAANSAGGIPGMYDDLIHFVAPRSQNSGTSALRMAGFDEVYLDSQFDNGSDGNLYEYEVIRWATTTVDGNPESLKRAGGGGAPNGFSAVEIQDLGEDKEAYRWTNLILNNRTRDDYDSIIQTGQAFSQSGEELYTATRQILDIDQWMRTAAYQSLTGPADAYYTGSNRHNFRLYVRPDDGQVMYMPWDWDSAFQRSTNASLVGGEKLGQIVRFPANLRLYYGHMLDIVETAYNKEYMSRWTEYYGSVSGQNFSGRLNYIDQRANFATTAIRADFPEIGFGLTNPASAIVNETSVTVTGTGWVNVKEIRLVERDASLDLQWMAGNGTNADTWATTIPLPFGTSVLTFEAYDFQGRLIGSEKIEIESTVSDRPLNDFLRVTELNYNPDGSDATEFIELTNISSGAAATTLDLSGVIIANGPASPFVFPDGSALAPSAYALIVADQPAFESAYPTVDREIIVGEFAGSLSNGGERISLTDSVGNEIVAFTYDDSGLWPEASDGVGASLEFIHPATRPIDQVDKYYSWRASSEFGGSPGTAGNGPVGVIVNEVLAHTDPPALNNDAIELYNSTAAPIDISGWFLSDSSNDLFKYAIPAGTMLAAGEYIVFDEQDFNPTPSSPAPKDFALSGAEGDDVWLVIPNGSGGVAAFVDEVHFQATFDGATLGVTENSNRRLVPLTRNTLGCHNSQPLIDDVTISTIHYLPAPPTAAALAIEPQLDANDLEFIIVDGSGQSLDGWRIRGGIDFDFPELSTTVPTTWIVSFDPKDPGNASKLAAFREQYGLSPLVPIIGGYAGSLSNTGEQIRLERPDTPPLDDPLLTPYVTVDEVIYDNQAPWPPPVAGDPIVRRASMFFGIDGDLWTHSSTFDLRDNVSGDFNGDDIADANDIDLLFDAVNRNSQNSDFVLSGTLPSPDELEIGFFIRDLLGTTFGDANLDGAVDGIDFGIWNDHKFQSCRGWASADFNGDGKTDVSDFNVWNDNKFLNAAPAHAARASEVPRQAIPVLPPESKLPRFRDSAVEPKAAESLWHKVGTEDLPRDRHDVAFASVAQDAIRVQRRNLTGRDTFTYRRRQTDVARIEIVDHIFRDLGSKSPLATYSEKPGATVASELPPFGK